MDRKILLVLLGILASLALVVPAFAPQTHLTYGEATPKQVAQEGASVSGRITLHAAGRGNPWINLRDGVDLPTTYTGKAALTQTLAGNLAQPLSLASGDFDEDGVPDLVSGYGGPGGSILTLHRGNVDAIYPNSSEAQKRKAEGMFTDLPFLSPARVFALPEAPEFLGTGDFDNDGHWDVVAAVRGSKALYLLPGDGRGSFGPAKQIELPGTVTAMATGEINRADGLADVVVGIVGPEGPQVLVFEGPEGALRGKPEVFALPAEATALALGQLDDSYEMDLAVAAGRELLIVHGRDRRLSLDEIRQAQVPPATIDQRALPFAITSLAVGDFIWDEEHRTDIALLSEDRTVHMMERQGTETGEWSDVASVPMSPGFYASAPLMVRARVSVGPTDDLVMVDQVNHQLHILMGDTMTHQGGDAVRISASPRPPVPVSLDTEGELVAVLPMRLNADALSDLVILKGGPSSLTVAVTASSSTFTVNSTGNGDDCDTKDGICSTGSIDTKTGKCVLTGICTLRAAIEQANASPGADAINFTVTSISPGGGLPQITGPVTIDGTTSPAGRVELSVRGLDIAAGSSTVRRMVINRTSGSVSSSGIGLGTNGGNVLEGNFFGTDVTGTVDLSTTQTGVLISSPNNIVGGTTAAARNIIISSLTSPGVVIEGSGNQVQGNFIGTDVTGTAALGGTTVGFYIFGSSNTVGGTTGVTPGGQCTGACNVISGSKNQGVWIVGSGTTGNLVQGNHIGTDVTGTAALGNAGNGVETTTAVSGNTIGGTARGAGNTIANNGFAGVCIACSTAGSDTADATGNAILSNSIFSNTGLGIDLGGNGVAPNDSGDSDTGANNLQNFPVLTLATSTTVQGTLNSRPNTTFRLEFFSNTECDPSGYGEGQKFIGPTTVTTDGSGDASFTVAFSTTVPGGRFITATATDPDGNTSEFSRCVEVKAATQIDYFALGDSVASGHGLSDGGPPCRQSAEAYPWLVLQKLQTQYDVQNSGSPESWFFACSGATTATLERQVNQVINKWSGRPTLVSITVGANDFDWANIFGFSKRLCTDEEIFRKWVKTITSSIELRLASSLRRLLSRPNVEVILTDYYNPTNPSGFFWTQINPVCGFVDVYERTALIVLSLNSAIENARARLPAGSQSRIHLSSSVYVKFKGHEAPFQQGGPLTCGTALPRVEATWVQYIGDKDSNSNPGGLPLSGDCFHPRRAGAEAIADAVIKAIPPLGH